jgi:hypothetical protein
VVICRLKFNGYSISPFLKLIDTFLKQKIMSDQNEVLTEPVLKKYVLSDAVEV